MPSAPDIPPPPTASAKTSSPAAGSGDTRWKRGLFWAALAPLTYAPAWVRYLLSDGLALILRYLLRYRKAVIDANLAIAFPEKSDAERTDLRYAFYRNFSDLILEQIWAFGARPADVLAMVEMDPTVLARFEAYRAEGRPVMVAAGHHNNYELGAAALALAIEMPMAVIYARLVDPFFDARVRESRTRFGMTLWARGQTAAYMADWHAAHGSFAVGFAFDQSPSSGRPKYWMPFFGKETAVQQGLDRFAHQYHAAVEFLWIKRVGRGRYRVQGDHICDDATAYPPGVVTALATAALERVIRQQPAGWMWSHRRWKLDPATARLPEDIAVGTDADPAA